MKHPELIQLKEAEKIGKKIDPNTGGCDQYERVHYAHPSIKKGCVGCRFNRFTYCVVSSCNKREEKHPHNFVCPKCGHHLDADVKGHIWCPNCSQKYNLEVV